jgi:hypothetical protein
MHLVKYRYFALLVTDFQIQDLKGAHDREKENGVTILRRICKFKYLPQARQRR